MNFLSQVLTSIFLLNSNSHQDPIPEGCAEAVATNCTRQLISCATVCNSYYQSDWLPHSNLDTQNPQDLDCISVLLCIAGCDPEDAECSYTCGMIGLENQPFLDISQCMADLGCLPTYPDDGTCLAEDADALQVAPSAELLGQYSINCL